MNNFTGFTDLCIPEARADVLEPIIREAIELGYRNLAIEQIIDVTTDANAASKQDVVPKPYCLKNLKASFGGQIRFFNRLTVIFSDASVSLVLNKSNNIRCYNLIAALPTTLGGLQYACQTMVCDIITHNSSTNPLRLARKYYYLAVERDIAFELKYAPTIVDSSERKATIGRAHRYHSVGKSKNVIISSEAKNPFQLRSPYDLANLGLIFGLSEEQSKESIRGIPNKILLSAESRRFGKAGVIIARRTKSAEDSDDYSDSELEQDISDDDENEDEGTFEDADMDDGNGTDEENDEKEQPPKKMSKHEKIK
uniref:Uncharacterized protein n=1 Tax=Anopheles funestus TaxID=62324 RepID=A0A182RRK8_ANOFN